MLPIARIDYCSIALSFMCIFNGIHYHSTHFVYAYPKKKNTDEQESQQKVSVSVFSPHRYGSYGQKSINSANRDELHKIFSRIFTYSRFRFTKMQNILFYSIGQKLIEAYSSSCGRTAAAAEATTKYTNR